MEKETKLEKELKEAQKVRDEAIKNEFDLKKELEKRDQQITQINEQNKMLTEQLNKISAMFEEQYSIIADQMTMLQLTFKQISNSKQLLDIKLKEFNGGGNQ